MTKTKLGQGLLKGLKETVTSEDASNGLTKREYFAAAAMQGLLANSYVQDFLVQKPLSTASNSEIAEMAVNQADALIDALNKNGEEDEQA